MPGAGGVFYPDLLKFRPTEEQQRLGKANESFHVEFLLKSLIMEVQKYIMSTSAFKEKLGTFGARIGFMLD